jgi:hypothetical protein
MKFYRGLYFGWFELSINLMVLGSSGKMFSGGLKPINLGTPR